MDPVIFLPVLPNDSSCANLARAHHNASTLWIFLALQALLAENADMYYKAKVHATAHIICRDAHVEIAQLNDPKILIIYL